MFKKSGWQLCNHCEGTGVCRAKILGIKKVLGIPIIPVRSSCASCLAAVGVDPSKYDFIVKCGVCDGTGYVWLEPKGRKNAQAAQNQ